jgi:hypothetical protein
MEDGLRVPDGCGCEPALKRGEPSIPLAPLWSVGGDLRQPFQFGLGTALVLLIVLGCLVAARPNVRTERI